MLLPSVADYFGRYQTIRGWFHDVDFRFFDFLLSSQLAGDLVEIGAYQGKSAILLGLHTRPGEILTVCDLFGGLADDDANRVENELQYADLTREKFERNYLDVLPTLPVTVERSSLEILDHVGPGTCRFVHVDGSHLYEHARSDIRAARTMLKAGGIVAVDDWRTEHTPGVTLAVMEQVAAAELHAIGITRHKFYGVFEDALAAEVRRTVTDWAATEPGVEVHVDPVRGEQWPRISAIEPPTPRRTLPRRILSRLRGNLHRYL